MATTIMDTDLITTPNRRTITILTPSDGGSGL